MSIEGKRSETEFGKERETSLWTLAKTKKLPNKKKPTIKACEGSFETQRHAGITVRGQESSSGRKVRPTVSPRVYFCCLRGRGIVLGAQSWSQTSWVYYLTSAAS